MSILAEVKRFYDSAGISPTNFRCKYLRECKAGSRRFTEAHEPYIGRGYDRATLPRLLFLSLDSGEGDRDPQNRTAEASRSWEEQLDMSELDRNKHWFLTHQLAATLLSQFKPNLNESTVRPYFAHTNSAKCCMNKDGREMADPRMFVNCRQYLKGELIALRPAILVTQGNWAMWAVEELFPPKSIAGDLKRCGHGILDLAGREVLWFHAYHPRFGGFFRQRRKCYSAWQRVVHNFCARA